MRWLVSTINSMDMRLSKLWEDSEGQGSLAFCSPQGGKESDTMSNRTTKNGGSDHDCFYWSLVAQ